MELISKREVLKIIEEETIDDEYKCEDGSWESYLDFQYEDAMKRINELPTIESRPKGKWLDSGSGWKCSNCGFQNEWTIRLKHCPECCADMREGEA